MEQVVRLKIELDKRIKDFKPVPFEDNTPSLYSVPEAEEPAIF